MERLRCWGGCTACPTPVNAALTELAARHAHRGGRPGELSVDEILAVAA